jgi:predicted PP-loop superfamily ATPase
MATENDFVTPAERGGADAVSTASVRSIRALTWTPDPLEILPAQLQKERQRLEKLFTVDTSTLKKITKRFGEELEEGKFLRPGRLRSRCSAPQLLIWRMLQVFKQTSKI